MPDTSDSEAFESADEDFVDPNPRKPAPSSVSVVKPNTETEEIVSVKVVETKIEDVLKCKPSVDVRIKEAEAEKIDSLKKSDLNAIEEPVKEDIGKSFIQSSGLLKKADSKALETNVEIVKPNKKDDPNRVISALEASAIKNIDAEPIPKEVKTKASQPNDEDDGWEFDDWGDDAQTPGGKKDESVPAAKSSADDEDVGWEVEDWGDDEPPVVLYKDNAKTDPKPSNLFGNFSQMLISSEDTKKASIQTANPLDRLSDSGDSASNWGWKPWGGVVSLLSTATDGVASITSHVSSVIESGIGVPDPTEMARIQQQERQKRLQEQTPEDTPSVDGPEEGANIRSKRGDDASLLLGQFVSGMTHIGNRVISGGLDTLEGIGKKTMTILKENDKGLLNKQRQMLMEGQGPALSQILREAKEKTEEAEKNLKLAQKQQYKKQLHFETLFDDYHGLVHLEALEMLSRQSAMKLKSLIAPLSGRALEEVQETLDEVKELCELSDSDSEDSDGTHSVDDLSAKIAEALEDLDVPIDFKELLDCWKSNAEWLANQAAEVRDPQAIHDKALRCLAETSAHAVHKLHKLAELLLIKERHSTANEADSLVQLTSTFCWHLSGIAARFGHVLSQLDNEDEANSLITSTFLEGSNSVSYIHNAFLLFIPILQVGAA